MARALGFDRAVASTTGDHGTALAAYAARAGMEALVFCDPRAPVVQRRMMQIFGARVVVLVDRGASRLARPRARLVPVHGHDTGAGRHTLRRRRLQRSPTNSTRAARSPRGCSCRRRAATRSMGPGKRIRELRALGASGNLPDDCGPGGGVRQPIVRGWRAGATTVPVHPDPGRSRCRSPTRRAGRPRSEPSPSRAARRRRCRRRRSSTRCGGWRGRGSRSSPPRRRPSRPRSGWRRAASSAPTRTSCAS